MIEVGVNGYGTIGNRVADAVAAQPDMELAGVAKTGPDYAAEAVIRKGYPLYAAIPDRAELFHGTGIDPAGEVEDMVMRADVIVDTTPSGVGVDNRDLYERYDTPAVFQGGEDPDVADAGFNARTNYDRAAAADASYVRVVSCNTTGLSRLLAPLDEEFGVEKARVTLVRRGGDPGQTSPARSTTSSPTRWPSPPTTAPT